MIPAWRTSTHSSSNGGDCIEVADSLPTILVRDTKDRDRGILAVRPEAWSAFVAHVGQDA